MNGAVTPRLTPAQERALAWLPGDGSWRDQPGRLSASLLSLRWFHNDSRRFCCERQWGRYGANGAEGFRWRLLDAGIALKRARALSEMAAMDGAELAEDLAPLKAGRGA